MSVLKVREFFSTQIAKVRPDLAEYEYDVFGNNDLTLTEARKNYNLIITSWDLEILDGTAVRTYSCQLDIWSVKGVTYLADFNNLVCEAEKIQEQCLSLQNIEAFRPDIYQVTAGVANGIEESTNDNAFKIRLDFSVSAGLDYNTDVIS